MTPISILRDIKLGEATGDYKITIDASNLLPSFFFTKQRRVLKDLLGRAVLCGSRALKCYRVNDRELMYRKPNDWDFLISQSNFLDFCNQHHIYDFDTSKSSYHMNKSFTTFYGGYGSESHWFPCMIQIIIKDEEPTYNEKDGIKFVKLENIIESKIELIESNPKHTHDINNIIVNLHTIKL